MSAPETMTRGELAAKLEELDRELAGIEAQARGTSHWGELDALAQQADAVRRRRSLYAELHEAAVQREMRDLSPPPALSAPRRGVDPFWGVFLSRPADPFRHPQNRRFN